MPITLGYSRMQIRLHWIIALLIVPQFLLADGISNAFRAFMRQGDTTFSPLAMVHIAGGALILLLTLWRISLRVSHGAPVPPEDEHPALKLVAKLTHGLLYLLLVLLPISGSIAWFGGVRGAAQAHEAMKVILLGVIGLHVVGALYHQFVLKTNLMQRMKTPV